MTTFIPTQRNLYDLLEDFKKKFSYNIPLYQREYRWETGSDKGCQPFFDDIFKNILSDDELHFFNSVVLIRNHKSKNTQYDIIDGQQRITSFMILNIAFETLFNDFKSYTSEKTITNKKEKERYKPTIKVCVNDILKGPKKLGGESKIKGRSLKEVLNSSFSRTKDKESFFNTTKFLITNYYKLTWPCSEKDFFEETFNSYLNETSKEDAKKTFEDFINKFIGKRLSKEDKTSIITNALAIYIAQDFKNDSFLNDYDNDPFCKFFMNSIYLLTNTSIKKIEDLDKVNQNKLFNDLKVIEKFFFRVNVKNISLNYEISKHKQHKFLENYIFFLEKIGEIYDDWIEKKIFKVKKFSDEDAFKKDANKSIFTFFKNQYLEALKKCFYIQIIIDDPKQDRALEAALSAFASINYAGEPLESWDIIFSRIVGDLGDKKSELFEKQIKECIEPNKEALGFSKFLSLKISKDEILKFFFAFRNKKYQTNLVSLYSDFVKTNSSLVFCNDILNFLKTIQEIDNGIINLDKKSQYSSALNCLGAQARKNKTIYPLILHILDKSTEYKDANETLIQLHFNLLKYMLVNGSKSFVVDIEKIMQQDDIENIKSSLTTTFAVDDEKCKLQFQDLNVNFYSGLPQFTKDITILNEAKIRLSTLHNEIKGNLLNSNYTIEHIIPQSYKDKKYYNLGNEKFNRLKNSFANLTLLTDKDNSSAGNKSLTGKFEVFIISGLEQNKKFIVNRIKDYNKKNKIKIDIDISKCIKQKKGESIKIFDKSKPPKDVTSEFNTNYVPMDYIFGTIDKDCTKIENPSVFLKEKKELIFNFDKFSQCHEFINDNKQFTMHRKSIWEADTVSEELKITPIK